MANKNQQPCKTCGGGGVINVGGTAQVCPMCDGTGKAYIPGLYQTYGVNINLNANAQAQQTISILNAPFKWVFSTYTSTGPFTIQIADAKNNRQFFNNGSNPGQLHVDLVFGKTASYPFPVLNPWTFDQNGAIQINVTDISAANNAIWLNFIGVQLIQSQSQGS